MATSIHPIRPLAGLKQALRQCRAERQRYRAYATDSSITPTSTTSREVYPSLMPNISRYNAPESGFRPSIATKQNRYNDSLRKIPTIPPPPSTLKACQDPIKTIYESQLKVLDPNGARTRLFNKDNPDRVHPGDILLVRLKNGDDFSGVALVIRQRHSPIDTAVLLRNQLTRVGVEMWFKVYSPNVEGIEIVQRRERRARRAKLYYMRLPKHDMGSVEGVVRSYLRTRAGGARKEEVKSKAKAKGKGGKKQVGRK